MTNIKKNLELIQNIKIYIIDDSKAFMSGIESILTDSGCNIKIKCFLDSEMAIETIFQEPPDIIITDLEMPKLTGLELIKLIREQSELASIPILVITSQDSSEQLVECLHSGADAFASKNTLQKVLLANIVALMRVARLRKQSIALKQFEAVKSLIGTYKHEFGNTLAIMDGKVYKLSKDIPDIINNDAYKSLQNAIVRFTNTLEKLSSLRNYKEEEYSDDTIIVKI